MLNIFKIDFFPTDTAVLVTRTARMRSCNYIDLSKDQIFTASGGMLHEPTSLEQAILFLYQTSLLGMIG